MQPIHIEFTLASPLFIDSEHPIHLDALLAYAAAKELEEQGADNAWEEADAYLEDVLERTSGDDWVWKASKLQVTARGAIQFATMTRKCEPERIYAEMHTRDNPKGIWVSRVLKSGEFAEPNGETFMVNSGSGQRRAYYWLAANRWVDKIEAHAIGDLGRVKYLLQKHLHGVGKAGRNGYGRVESISVRAGGDAQAWKLRVLPLHEAGLDGVEYAQIQGCLRAPYWNKLAQQVVKEPIW